jgi:hypothetical protein
MPAEVSVYVELSDLVPRQKCTLAHLAECLGALPLNSALLMCARANQIISGPGTASRMDRQRKLANSLLSTEAGQRLNRVVRARSAGDPAKTFLFFRAQLLELVRWVLLLCNDETVPAGFSWTQTEKELFVQAALICSRISEAKVLATLRDNVSVPALKDIALVFFRAALDASLIAPDPYRVFGRGQQLFLEYLPKHYPNLDENFRQATGMSVFEYMTTAGVLAAMHLQLNNSMILRDAVTLGSDTKYADTYRAYQELQVWDIEELRERLWPGRQIPPSFDEIPPFDLKPLREKPIIALDDGRGVIPDPVLLADSILVGPVFHLARVRNANYVFGQFGDAFEEYVCDILERMFPRGAGLHQRLYRNVPAEDAQGRTLQIDACLDYVDRLVLIEANSVFIRDASVVACDEIAFRAELEKKYLKGEREVVIGQLARTICSLAGGSWPGPGSPGEVNLVYPVAIVHDRLLQEPVVTKQLAEMLISESGATRVASSWQWEVNGLRCAPLTILTIDDLENLEYSIQNVALMDLLEAYSSRAPERRESLHDFIASSEFRNAMRMNRSIADAGRIFLEDAGQRVFGSEISKKGKMGVEPSVLRKNESTNSSTNSTA